MCRPVLSLFCVFLIVAVSLLSACATTKQRGDRAFEAKQYNQALDHYEVAIEQESRDPELYFNAAKAAVRVGDFSLAERYYSRALRYGGGSEVARSLAEFYIATSNYTKAVRVLQQLLETTDEPQPVFNNLGAALMYAGAPLDAESYLLVAQQMKPTDPVPYINLGVLYDKHMHQPRLALGFYHCFLKLGEAGKQRRKIEARVKELEVRFRGHLAKRHQVVCGEAYQPAQPPSPGELRRRLADQMPDDEPPVAGQADDGQADDGQGDIEGEREGDEEPIEIDRGPSQVLQADQTPDDEDTKSATPEPSEALRLAESAFAKQNYEQVIEYLESVPASGLDARAMALYGRSLASIGEHQRAQRWLAAAVEEAPNPENVAALLGVYEELGATVKIEELCRRFEDDDELDAVLENCPKKKVLEHLKNKQR